jgi:hypothetical protein
MPKLQVTTTGEKITKAGFIRRYAKNLRRRFTTADIIAAGAEVGLNITNRDITNTFKPMPNIVYIGHRDEWRVKGRAV